ncbi:MAG: hypothetical protein OXI16_07345 [Chloroflexota bacterium]|nr:hypothetical protein [Chloroflexota bacterium]
MVLTRRWLEREEAKKNQELTIDKVFEQGIKHGKAVGRLEVQRKWEGWNYRRMLAKEQGRDFNEPPAKPGRRIG